MDTIFETRDVLLALSYYMEQHKDFSRERLGELQKTFDEIATDEVVLVRKGE